MSKADRAQEFGREPISFAELDLDYCQNTFGVSPCTATGEKCYNTYATCKDKPNYIITTKTYTFVEQERIIPVGVNAFPSLKTTTFSPTRLEFGKGLGYRGKCTVTLADFAHNDIGIDPYVTTRSYDTSRGTFNGKLVARNPYYNGRTMRIRTGYNGTSSGFEGLTFPEETLFPSDYLYPEDNFSLLFPDDAIYPSDILWPETYNYFDANNFDTREYIIENISINSMNNTATITGKDILKKLDSERTQVPAQSEGALTADATSVQTSIYITAAYYADYPTSGYVRINDEIIQYTGKTSPDLLTGLVRGSYGTIADAHKTDDKVQLCKIYTLENVVDIINDILVNYGGIPSSYIPYDNGVTGINQEWDTEKETYLAYANFTTVISEPTGADELLQEISEQAMLLMWWDERTQKVRLKSLTPPTQREVIATLTDSNNILKKSVKYNRKDDDRYSQLWVYSNPVDWSQLDEDNNFQKIYIGADTDAEAVAAYGDTRIMKIKSRWIALDSQSITLWTRFNRIYSEPPIEITAKLDAKDGDISTGDFVDITTAEILNPDGSQKTFRAFITEVKEVGKMQGHEFQITAMSTGFVLGLKYGFIAKNTIPDYTTATDDEKRQYAFVAVGSTSLMSDGEDAYRII